jgi:hypothetical protein
MSPAYEKTAHESIEVVRNTLFDGDDLLFMQLTQLNVDAAPFQALTEQIRKICRKGQDVDTDE